MTIRAIIGRAEAKAQGLKRYFTGIPCKHGHTCERTVGRDRCVECKLIWLQAWRKANPEKWQGYISKSHAKHAVTRRKSVKKWRRENPDVVRAIQIAKRARKINAEGRYTKSDIVVLLKKQHNQCLCETSFNVTPYTVDHIVPLSRNGSNWPSNLQLLCLSCNDSKGTKLMCEWVVPMRRVA